MEIRQNYFVGGVLLFGFCGNRVRVGMPIPFFLLLPEILHFVQDDKSPVIPRRSIPGGWRDDLKVLKTEPRFFGLRPQNDTSSPKGKDLQLRQHLSARDP